MADEYISFEKVLKELQIKEEELKKLVSAGEIKAFREEDEMKFDLTEIKKLMDKKKSSDPDVIELLDSEDDLEAESAPTLDSDSLEISDELSFDDDLDSEVGMATAQIGDDDFLNDDLDDAGEEEVDLESLEFEEEEESADVVEEDLGEAVSTSRKRGAVKKTRIAGISDAAEDDVEPQWALGLMIVSAIVLILATIVVIDIATSMPSPAIEWLVGIFT